MSDKEVRTRFAPSPTGYMHIGNLRTALYAYLIAKSQGGKFILRIEDTDQSRLVEGAADIIYSTLKETGLIHDEGPDIGGPVGPYIQSERRSIYKEYAEKLVKNGSAYYCFCDKERLDALRAKQEAVNIPTRYDGHCLKLSPSEIEEKLNSGVPYVIRQKIPRVGTTTFDDIVYGKVSVDNSTLDDQILLKSDGLPTYNFANVVDDHLMGITHVIRGSEYLSSSPKYNLLYEAFGWDIPVYIHCPPVMKDAHTKLSKRNGDASYQDLVAKGYLKDAVVNYIALLGWAPGGEQEVFSLSELIDAFKISGISKSPAIFDIEKLNWLNGEYIRSMSLDEFYSIAKPYIDEAVKGDFDKKFIASLLQPRCELLSDIPSQLDFFDTLPDYETALYIHKRMKTKEENSLTSLQAILPVLENLNEWTTDAIHNALFDLIKQMEVKNGIVLWPLRTAVSGKKFTPGGGIELAFVLGKDETLRRIRIGIEKLSSKVNQ